ncbi:flagellar basal body-associated protein FliL [Nocardioides luteus]|uniref:Nitrate/nitrite sensing protein domain-containing protein n=1 Tax=Nocardioides luteus TaxID=1844 RepID=A0ABQ5SXQ0_9ACTN|nr:nitrate- and nitrite sensing domain-containing protein [Nocardioides luteus]MDR7312155.1 flagellar basal body-associated protein FliL [Nocardioides luteus]GGR56371.1 hypothetical protein GCM10010197_23790 [Nocardioides luteus]GLJ68400.1 hypothetical protein GCM10017579_24360 [Nocardioides luteus]
MTGTLDAPTRPPASKGVRIVGVALILVIVVALVVGVLGALAVSRALAQNEESRRAEAIAETLPVSVDLAYTVSFEREAVSAGVPPLVLRPVRQSTDLAATAWLEVAAEIDSRDDEELAARLDAITRGIEGIDEVRAQADADPSTMQKPFTELAGELFAVATHVPAAEGRADSRAEAFDKMPQVWESLGTERKIMTATLPKTRAREAGPISAGDLTALTEAEAAVRAGLADFYAKTSDQQREALDRITADTSEDGAVGVPVHQAVNQVVADGDVAAVRMTPDAFTEASTGFMRELHEVLMASADEIVAETRSAKHDATRAALVGMVLTVVVLGVLAVLILVLGIVLLVMRGSRNTAGARR